MASDLQAPPSVSFALILLIKECICRLVITVNIWVRKLLSPSKKELLQRQFISTFAMTLEAPDYGHGDTRNPLGMNSWTSKGKSVSAQ